MMIEILLQRSMAHKTLVGFHEYNSESYYCGYVINHTEDFVMIQHYSKFGVKDGILVRHLTDFKIFESESEYLKGLQTLIDHQEMIVKQKVNPSKIEDFNQHFTNLFEQYVGNKEVMIKFETNDGEIYFGYLEWCDEESFSILEIDSDGLLTGRSLFRIEDLKMYFIDDLNCRKRNILYKARYNSK
jgi:hypothetical protein